MPDLPKFDLNLLTLFDALHRTRSVTGAAQQLGLSQPATSSALGRMRRQFDDPLFVRTPQGMVPTPLADEIAPAIQDALDTVRRRVMERHTAKPADSARTLRLSINDASGLTVLPRIVSKLQRVAPQWRVETEAAHPDDLPRALEAGEFDLAIGNLYMLGDGTYRQKLLSSNYKVIHRRSHPRLRSALTLHDFLSAEHAVMRRAGGPASLLEQALLKRGQARKIVLSVPQFLLLPPVVAESDLVATVPEHVARAFAGPYQLAVWPLPVPMAELTLYQYWHRRNNADTTSRWVRGLIRQLFTQDQRI